jgi:hypothetical protein
MHERRVCCFPPPLLLLLLLLIILLQNKAFGHCYRVENDYLSHGQHRLRGQRAF